MEKYAAILGFIAVCLAGVHCQNTVSVTKTKYMVKPGQSAALSCLGSSGQLDYYIKNRLNWEFINSQGQKFPLTEGFYPTTSGEAYADAHFGTGHFEHEYSSGANNYIFKLKINGAVDGDDGVYRCALVNAKNEQVDFKDVTVTVLRPVEKVTIEIHNPKTHAVLAKKTVPATAQDQAIELRPGNYMVKCVATGSNPEPEVEFMYNQDKTKVTWNTDRDTSGPRVKFTKQFSKMNFQLTPSDMDQYLTCSANIAEGDYAAKTASIKMVVRIDKPGMVCSNTSAMLNDHYTKITCNLTGRGLMCDKVKWVIGNNDDIIDAESKYGDEKNAYDIMETFCDDLGDRLETSLEIYEVKASHFDTLYYLSYGIGQDAHRIPVQLMQKPGSGTLITPLSLCIYLVLAFVAKQAFQRV